MGGTAHQPSWPPMAARCQAPPSTHLSGTQEQSGTSNPGCPERAISHPTVESKVVHELNKPKRDEPAVCTVASIS
eukprot:scaffold13252_cov101-Isochrysis_galbana.AAC.1